MEAGPVQGLSASVSYRSGASEEAIDVCEKLLSSGQSFSEILVALKRLGSRNKDGLSDLSVEAMHKPGMLELAGNPAALDPPPLEASCRAASGGLVVADASTAAVRSLIALPVRASADTPVGKGKLSPLVAGALFWLIPAMALLELGTAGKLLTDARDSAAPGSQTEKIVLTAPAPEPTRTTPPITPDQIEPARAALPVLTGSSAAPPSETVVTSQHGRSPNTRNEMRPRVAPIQRQWVIPGRLTDGL